MGLNPLGAGFFLSFLTFLIKTVSFLLPQIGASLLMIRIVLLGPKEVYFGLRILVFAIAHICDFRG